MWFVWNRLIELDFEFGTGGADEASFAEAVLQVTRGFPAGAVRETDDIETELLEYVGFFSEHFRCCVIEMKSTEQPKNIPTRKQILRLREDI